MIIRNAILEDIPQLVAFGARFNAESGYGWTYSPENAAATYALFIEHKQTTCLVIESKCELMAAAVLAVSAEFSVETIGFFQKFYCFPKARGTGASRMLVGACMDWFASRRAVSVFVTATGNIDGKRDRQFENLFAKFGFGNLGPTMAWSAK